MADSGKETIEKAKVPEGIDRRTDPRYKFTGIAEVVAQSGVRLKGEIGDIGRRGCYVESGTPFPLQTIVKVRIAKGNESFEATARVVFSLAGKGMGLLFTAVDSSNQDVLSAWLLSSLESSWLTSNRRRSQRILVQLPVTVSGKNGRGVAFEERVQTQSISAHGALILLSASVTKGQTVTMTNTQPEASQDCIVAHIGEAQGNRIQIGVAFVLPNPLFWHATFPPPDWSKRSPDAK
jgi:hypothetical protein